MNTRNLSCTSLGVLGRSFDANADQAPALNRTLAWACWSEESERRWMSVRVEF